MTDYRTLCCSLTCEKRFECAKADINNEGTHCVEDYSHFGTGTFTDNGCEIEHWCGKLGDYKMFEPIENKLQEVEYDKQRRKDAFKYIEAQLESGYLDLGFHDQDELEVVKEALNILKIIDEWNALPEEYLIMSDVLKRNT